MGLAVAIVGHTKFGSPQFGVNGHGSGSNRSILGRWEIQQNRTGDFVKKEFISTGFTSVFV